MLKRLEGRKLEMEKTVKMLLQMVGAAGLKVGGKYHLIEKTGK